MVYILMANKGENSKLRVNFNGRHGKNKYVKDRMLNEGKNIKKM
jgi:hypothetical protein